MYNGRPMTPLRASYIRMINTVTTADNQAKTRVVLVYVVGEYERQNKKKPEEPIDSE